MSKSKAAKRKRKAQAELPNKQLKTSAVITPPPSDGASPEPKNLQTIVSDEELDITIRASPYEQPSMNSARLAPQASTMPACTLILPALTSRQHVANVNWPTEGANLTSRISGALVDGKYTEARILLAEMRIRGEQPKLGALCRWVRDLDIISGLSTKPSGDGHITVKRSAEDLDRLAVVDAILRVVGPTDSNIRALPNHSDPIAVQEVWNLRSSTDREEVYASVLDKTLLQSQSVTLGDSLRIIETTEGVDRKPPNHHPAILYTSTPDAVPLASQGPSISFQPHPVVPGLGLALNVLSPSECKAIIAAGETVNFIPDAPLREDGDISILAHNFYWVVDTAFHDALWSRISPYVPASVGGRKARGINRRFRVYRYVPGAEYRCHIDGAWPPSGILPDDTYVYDASPAGKKQSSLFTFLVYLNDEFEGGETTFFVPAAKEGTLNAYPVKPVMGAVAIFPHGETRGALLHEGTGVRKGAKYVIRTDVEYDVEPSPEA